VPKFDCDCISVSLCLRAVRPLPRTMSKATLVAKREIAKDFPPESQSLIPSEEEEEEEDYVPSQSQATEVHDEVLEEEEKGDKDPSVVTTIAITIPKEGEEAKVDSDEVESDPEPIHWDLKTRRTYRALRYQAQWTAKSLRSSLKLLELLFPDRSDHWKNLERLFHRQRRSGGGKIDPFTVKEKTCIRNQCLAIMGNPKLRSMLRPPKPSIQLAKEIEVKRTPPSKTNSQPIDLSTQH